MVLSIVLRCTESVDERLLQCCCVEEWVDATSIAILNPEDRRRSRPQCGSPGQTREELMPADSDGIQNIHLDRQTNK
jgi:hypothetical protein